MFARFDAPRKERWYGKLTTVPVEVNLDLVEFFEEKDRGTSIVFGQRVPPTFISQFESVKPVLVTTFVTTPFTQVMQEFAHTRRSADQPGPENQTLKLNGYCVNLARVALISTSKRGSMLTFASGNEVTSALTPDQIRSAAPRCFLPLVDPLASSP